MDQHDEIRERIKSRIASLGLNPRNTALKSGLSETTLRKFLEGETESLTVRTLTKLGPVLQVSTQWLLTGVSAQIIDLWERIPADRRDVARTVLEGLAEQK